MNLENFCIYFHFQSLQKKKLKRYNIVNSDGDLEKMIEDRGGT